MLRNHHYIPSHLYRMKLQFLCHIELIGMCTHPYPRNGITDINRLSSLIHWYDSVPMIGINFMMLKSPLLLVMTFHEAMVVV